MNHGTAQTSRRPLIAVALGVAVVALTVFKVPLGTLLLLGLVLLCPLLMAGMHGGGHDHGGQHHADEEDAEGAIGHRHGETSPGTWR